MPQIGNKCPGMKEYHTFESGFCLNSCDHQCVPASVLVHIQNRVRVDKHIGQYISVTSLLGCLRQLYLERTLEYFVEPPKSWWSLRGSILHRILEQPGAMALLDDLRREIYRSVRTGEVKEEAIIPRWTELELKAAELINLLPKKEIPNWQSETEYEWPTGVWHCEECQIVWQGLDQNREYPDWCLLCHKPGIQTYLRGTIDVLRPESGEIYDYKTIGDRGLSIIKDGAKKDHVTQFNLYKMLVEWGYPVGQKHTYKPIKVSKITAFYMTMMQIARTGALMPENTDWLVDGGTGEESLKKHPNVVSIETLASKDYMKLKRGKRKQTATPDDYELQKSNKFRVTYAVPEVPLLPNEQMAEMVRSAVPILVNAFKFGKMPPMCPPEMRQWKCEGYCHDQIREACDQYNLTTGEKRIVEVPEDTGIPIEIAA